MLKVVLAAPIPPPYGGIGNWVLLLKKYIQNRDDIEFLYLNTAPASRAIDGRSLWQRVVVQGITMLKLNRQLKKMIQSEHLDTVHITTSGQLAIIRDIMLLKTAKRYSVKTVYHIRFGRTDEISLANTREWKFLKKAMKLASVIMPIDKSTEAAVRRELPEAYVDLIPNPIDIEKLHPYIEAASRKSITFVGWMVKTKGVEELLEAWDEISEKFPDYSLDLVGPGDVAYIERLKSLYKCNHVVFHGEKNHDEALRIMSECKIFVLPSYTEGFPNVILEAMALRKPIIATDVGAIPDMLSGNCGEVFPARSMSAVRDTLIHLIPDAKKQEIMAGNAYIKVNKEYSLDTVFEQYMNVWRSTGSNNPQGD